MGACVGWIDYTRTCQLRFKWWVLPVGLELRKNHRLLGKSRVFPIMAFTYVVSFVVRAC